jgi:hypothetical protein
MDNSTDSAKGNAYEDLLIMTAMNKNKDLQNLIENSSEKKLEQSFIGKIFSSIGDTIKQDVEDNISHKFKKNEDIRVGESSLYERKRSVIKNVIQLKKNNEWDEYFKNYTKHIDDNTSLKSRFKTVFNINSDFVVIWKITFSIFVVLIIYLFFFKYMFIDLPQDEKMIKSNVIAIYHLINLMFFFESIYSVLIIISNGGSLLSYIKLPFKFYNAIPFKLSNQNFYYILPKFIRFDLVEKIFTNVETFTNRLINTNIQNYFIKIFLTYINQMFKYLLIF